MVEKLQIQTAPHSKESEMMVLGCMLSSTGALNDGADGLESKDFYFKEHQLIFGALRNLYRQDKPADVHIVSEELKRQGQLEDIGGVAYLTTLSQYAGTSAFVDEYISLVKNKSLLRRMISAAQEIEKTALNGPPDVVGALDNAQALLFSIGQEANTGEGFHIKDIISGSQSDSKTPYLKELQQRQEHFHTHGEDASLTGISTHFLDLDRVIDGLGKSQLIIVAGRPAMGKTAFVLNLAENVCFKGNVPVGIFSLEMTAEQLLHRSICSQSEVESDKIRRGSLSGIEYQRVVESINNMQKHTMIIDDQPGLKISDLKARARRMKEVYNIQLLVIDYLQLLSGSNSYGAPESRQLEISEISRMLKTLARELNIPIVCPSQLSRKVEERAGHRPMMSDLRESGSIEQDADVVMFLLRREYYDPYDKPGMAEVIVAKNRHGKIGNIEMAYRKELAQFANYTPPAQDSEDNAEAFSAFNPSSD